MPNIFHFIQKIEMHNRNEIKKKSYSVTTFPEKHSFDFDFFLKYFLFSKMF